MPAWWMVAAVLAAMALGALVALGALLLGLHLGVRIRQGHSPLDGGSFKRFVETYVGQREKRAAAVSGKPTPPAPPPADGEPPAEGEETWKPGQIKPQRRL